MQSNFSTRAKRCGRAFSLILLWLVVGTAWLWAFLALWFFSPLPAWGRVVAALAWLVATGWCLVCLSHRSSWRAIMLGVIVVLLIWSLPRPSHDRTWAADQARMPRARFDGDLVTIENLRYTTHRSVDDYDVSWCQRQYDLNQLQTVDFIIEPFASWRGPAHTFLTFGFADGRHVAISAEIRKERGESYSPLKGLFRNYEIMYVVGDERDLIGSRRNVRKNPLYLYPLKATPAQARSLLVAMLERANRLAERPEFYNTLTNTCTTNIVRHFEDVTGNRLPWDVRILLPGYCDALAYDLGLIDCDGSLQQVRQQVEIVDVAVPGDDERAWSRQIRQGVQRSIARPGRVESGVQAGPEQGGMR